MSHSGSFIVLNNSVKEASKTNPKIQSITNSTIESFGYKAHYVMFRIWNRGLLCG